MQKRILVFGSLMAFISMGAITAGPDPGQDPKPPWKNVKVVSKNLDEEQMEGLMHGFNAQLGVTCIYCHVTDTINGKHFANFYSDAMPAKKVAREMMKMTVALNRKYFNTTMKKDMSVKPRIWCTTCHRGIPIPVNKSFIIQ